jgi:alkylation response protein AidB-like acyl-CoA dehydrogenase
VSSLDAVGVPPGDLSSTDLQSLRSEVRQYARAALSQGRFAPRVNGMVGVDRDLSLDLARQGWVGTMIPPEFGGHPRSAPAQWVIAEELIASGMPLAAHWGAERQTARLVLRFGSKQLQELLLPQMARGAVAFGIAMSEPESGSDLASVRTRAVASGDRWVINGQKIWTSNAYRMDYLVVLCRTSNEEDHRTGLSQLLVPTSARGLEIRRIESMDGDDDICEVFFTDVSVPHDHLIGTAGDGWRQITTELSFERAWPDRYLTNIALIESFRQVVRDGAGRVSPQVLGEMVARLMSLRSLSWQAVAGAEANKDVSATAALAKDAGTTFEQSAVDAIRAADVDGRRHEPGPFRTQLRQATALSPSLTLRGGTNEILRQIIGKQLKAPLFRDDRTLVEESVEELLRRECKIEGLRDWDRREWSPELWSTLVELGFATGLADAGQGELGMPEACGLMRTGAYYLAPVPLAEAGFLAAWLLNRAGWEVPDGSLVVLAGTCNARGLRVSEDGVLSGSAPVAPFGSVADEILAIAWNRGTPEVVIAPPRQVVEKSGESGFPVWGDDVVADGVRIEPERRAPISAELVDELWLRGALARSVQMVGAMGRMVDLAIVHTAERHQFGRPIAQFQAVRDHLVVAARELALARAATHGATAVASQRDDADGLSSAVAVAKATANRASVEVARRVHQVHGAIGTTREYPLHALTLRLAAWRDDFGTEQDWESRIGCAAAGADHVWDFVTQIEVAG